MKRIISISVLSSLLTSCYQISKNIEDQTYITKDSESFDSLIDQFYHNIESIWGIQEILVAGPKDYVKYTDCYSTRSHINFESGTITFETVNKKHPNEYLKKAIVNTILMNSDQRSIDLYSDNDVSIGKKVFLYGQILDDQGRPIQKKQHAKEFAEYVLKNKLKIRNTLESKKIWFVVVRLIENHVDERAKKYYKMIRRSSEKYGVDQSLILAIIQTESSFNPYATSASNALGLMQILQNQAGRDVFKIQKKIGEPTRSYLFNPEKNIDIGTAYLSILQKNYLGKIFNKLSRRYITIVAYNSGVTNVLHLFSNKKSKAFQIINKMKPIEVYRKLYFSHLSIETRKYLYKVNKLQKKYLFWKLQNN